MKPPLPQRIGRYEVLDRLGEGGMGLLYLARDPVLDRTVAIKVLSVFNDEIKRRFAGEARSAARLTHPNIITIYDVGEDQGQPFIAMEYIDGETIGEVIRRRAPLRLVRRLELVLQLCSGLGHAHKMGIIHRDIKPANLMLTVEGVLKILDFGLARIVADAASSGLTRAGAMLGTPHYMSPEQAMGLPADHRSDIFAVGLVMYELLTWQKAFSGDSPHVVMHRIAHESPRPIRQLFPMIDTELEAVVDMALERDPDKRFQSLSAFSAACVKAKDNIIAQADSTTVRVERPAPGPPADPDTPGPGSVRADSGSSPERKTPVGGVRLPSREALTRRRADQIDRYIGEARNHLEAGRHEAAIEQCELALILDTGEPRALEMLHTAHVALEDQQVQHWLADARSALSRGSLSAAEQLVTQSLQVRPDASDVQALHQEIAARRDEQRSARERARAVAAAVERARERFENGEFDSAVKAATEALNQEPAQQEALDLKARAEAAIEQRRRQQEIERRAQVAVSEAQQRAKRGDHAGAIAALRAFEPPVTVVQETLAALEAEERQLERQRREEAERQRRAQEEADRQRRAHEALVRQRQAQEAERQERLRPDAERRPPSDADAVEPTVLRPAAEPEAIAAKERNRDPQGPRRLEGDVRRRAAAVAMQARRQFVAGDHQAALATLHGFSPQELVAPVIAELETELRRQKRRRPESAIRPAMTGPVPPRPAPPPSVPHPEASAPRAERPPVQRPHVDSAPAPRSHPAPVKMPVPDTPAGSLSVISLTWTHGAIALAVLVLFIAIAAIAYSCG